MLLGLFWKGDTTLVAENYSTYWLVDPGADPLYGPYRVWVVQGDNSLTSKNGVKLFKPTRSSFYKSNSGNANYVMPTGWIP